MYRADNIGKSILKKNSGISFKKQNHMDIVCFSHLRWDFVYQRPQHILTRMAKWFRVFYVEEPIAGASSTYFESNRKQDNLWVIVPHLAPGISEDEVGKRMDEITGEVFASFNIKSYIAWYYTPMAYLAERAFWAELVIYDCMDELSAFLHSPPELKHREKLLMERADIVFTGGYSLYEAKKDRHLNIHLFPSSIDKGHFHRARMMNSEFEDQNGIGKPRIGFFGVIDERMDVLLLEEIADSRPQWHFILIGPTVKIDPAILPVRDNIHYLGPKSYDDLPRYISQWNVAIMPFAINESTRFISPTKTPEYLAAGKPVVSTPVYDVVHSYGNTGFVFFAGTADEFVNAIEKALSIDVNMKWLKSVDDVLSHNSWDKTCEKMLQLIAATLPKQKRSMKESDHV